MTGSHQYEPIVQDGQYLGMRNSASGEQVDVPCLDHAQHPIEALGIMHQYGTDAVAVCDPSGFKDCIYAVDLAQQIGAQWAFQTPGSTIWFLSDRVLGGEDLLAIEGEGLRVIAHATDWKGDTEQFINFIRLDQPDPSAAVAVLERKGATILGYAPKGRSGDEMDENFDHLMHFMNL